MAYSFRNPSDGIIKTLPRNNTKIISCDLDWHLTVKVRPVIVSARRCKGYRIIPVNPRA